MKPPSSDAEALRDQQPAQVRAAHCLFVAADEVRHLERRHQERIEPCPSRPSTCCSRFVSTECDWGRVLVWEAAESDRARVADHTRVGLRARSAVERGRDSIHADTGRRNPSGLEHRQLERHGAGGALCGRPWIQKADGAACLHSTQHEPIRPRIVRSGHYQCRNWHRSSSCLTQSRSVSERSVMALRCATCTRRSTSFQSTRTCTQ